MTQKQKEQNRNSSTSNFLLGVLIGSVVGAATALLFAPKSGKELRIDITNQYENLKDKSSELKETVIEKSSDLTNAAKEKTEQLRQFASEKATVVKETAGKLKEKISSDGWKKTVNPEAVEAIEETTSTEENGGTTEVESTPELVKSE